MKYAKPPLVVVLAEVRHLKVPPLSDDQVTAVKTKLADVLPLHRQIERGSVSFAVNPHNPGATPIATTNKVRVDAFGSRDGLTLFTAGPESYSLETATYDGWDSFRSLLERVTEARIEAGRPDGVNRLGLRYVDEIRLPASKQETPNWSKYLDPQVIAPMPGGMSLQVEQQQAIVQYSTDRDDDTLTLRYGAVNGPPSITADVRPKPPAPGHYFLLDTDAAWTPTGTPEFDGPTILKAADRIHTDVTALFESTLTDKVRREVFGGH
ncbi:TIGR04255 family protein [Promicromonospora iranensis]|uniref:Uncharacterized protein (TIGR04255 family) n=1 Tax=Promicromonospora iranensis TaxID=1105144 RepID=A0ABU2CQI1_9MICO|nr:TIGR04255 family protein [Promicromonospora iranensis]MDR7383598.1 uncharacterized protein (TIGR04255 family) [Promicromonospora iranensis]